MTVSQLGDRIAELAARINIATYEMLTLIAEFDRHWSGKVTRSRDVVELIQTI